MCLSFVFLRSHDYPNDYENAFRQVARRNRVKSRALVVQGPDTSRESMPSPLTCLRRQALCHLDWYLGQIEYWKSLFRKWKCKLSLRSFRSLESDDFSRWPQTECGHSRGCEVERTLEFIFAVPSPQGNLYPGSKGFIPTMDWE